MINPTAVDDVVGAIEAELGRGADYTLETTGEPTVLRQATDCLAPSGECGLVGAPPMRTEASLDVNHMLNGGRTLRGIVEGDAVPKKFIPELLELYYQGKFPFDELVTFYEFNEFNEINRAVADVDSGECVKPVLRM